MNKTKRRGAVHVDDRLPAKSAAGNTALEASVPTYDGPAKTDSPPARHTRGAGPAKSPAGKVNRPRVSAKPPEYGDQVPSTPDPDHRREQYIRLRVRVRGSQLTVLDSHLVDGPLGQAAVFATANAYEITVDDRLLHAGALPDLGIQRSFVNPEGPPEQQGHHFTERPIFEFTARVPAHEVTPESLPRLVLRLHRLKDEARTDRLGAEPLAAQFPREVRAVAELVGLPDSVLPEAIEARGGRTPNAG